MRHLAGSAVFWLAWCFHHQVPCVCVIGNLGSKFKVGRPKTPRGTNPAAPMTMPSGPGMHVRAITRQPQRSSRAAEYNPDYTGDFQRARPGGLTGDFPRAKFGVVNAVAEVNHDAERKPVNQPLPR